MPKIINIIKPSDMDTEARARLLNALQWGELHNRYWIGDDEEGDRLLLTITRDVIRIEPARNIYDDAWEFGTPIEWNKEDYLYSLAALTLDWYEYSNDGVEERQIAYNNHIHNNS